MADYSIKYISGMNNSDPSNTIPDDQAVSAVNVEFWDSALGERRAGCIGVDVPAAFTGDANIQFVPFLARHTPSTDETGSELWALGAHRTTQNFSLQRKTTVWATVTPDIDIDTTNGRHYNLSGVSFHGKFFFAYRKVGGIDRLMVWDGTTLRKAGLAEPAAPTAAETGAGTFSGIRYYRVRYTVQAAGVTLRRSEPSDAVTYNPATFGNNGASARVTKPATISEGETHWELEASIDNANFYVIATTVVGTTTYDDSTAFATGYGAFELSPDTGDYTLQHSAKFLTTDDDKLLMAGAWEDDAKASRVTWTPAFGDPEGDGNDERLELDTDPFLDLDNYEGGPITFMSHPINGQIWVFKRSRTFILMRTGQREKAYNSIKVSNSVGAIPGSVIQGVDETGMPCLYFLDYKLGPCRTGGKKGVQSCGKDILTTWESVNLNALVVARAVFYPKKQQVIWQVALGDLETTSPTTAIVLHTANTVETQAGVRGGWAIWTGKIGRAFSSCLYSDNINDNEARNVDLVPLYGVTSTDGYILQGDSGVDDDGTAYAASILTKPLILRGLLNKFGVGASALLAEPDAAATVKVTIHRDFGLEEPSTFTTPIAATGSETQVIKQMRSLRGSQMYAMQIEFEDPATPLGQWKLNRFDIAISDQETAHGKGR